MTKIAPAAEPELKPPILVIGCGSELRGDDAAGLRVAEEVAGWRIDSIRSIAVHQLLPELAEAVSAARAVVFVDADESGESDKVRVWPVDQAVSPSSLGHTGDPAWLMALAGALFGRRPYAWLVTIPARSTRLGDPVSAQAKRGIAVALRRIRALAGGGDERYA